ncbi:MAG TPA: hypothetical protein VL418_15160 [Devosiaceae bacterium]|nr:hypothetical protein [Devosiaceae bacterium]
MIRAAVLGLALASCLLSVGGAYASANGANDYLLAQSPSAQAAIFTKAIGRGCTARTVFYMGTGVRGFPKNHAIWNARCASGATYAIKVAPDGSNQVIECTVFEAMNGLKCFKKPAVK